MRWRSLHKREVVFEVAATQIGSDLTHKNTAF